MATSVKEDWRLLAHGVNVAEGSATRYFTVKYDAGTDPLQAVIIAKTEAGIPRLWDQHPFDEWLFVVNIQVTVADSGLLYFGITISYQSVEDPIAADPEISWGFVSSNEPIDRDIDDEPITNSADETFDPPITRDVDDLVLRIARNEPVFDPVIAADYKNAVNDDYFYGFAPGLCRMTSIEAVTARAGGLYYWRITYEVQIRKDGWLRKILDQGFRTKTGTDTDNKPTYANVTDDAGNQVTEPILLDGDGARLADGTPAVFKEFDLYNSIPFAGLSLEYT